MKGTTHLAIGAAIGAAACAIYPFSFKNAACYLAVAAFSALSADLDGQNMLSAKVGKASRLLRNLALWIGVLSVACAACFYFIRGTYSTELSASAVLLLLLGLIAKEGFMRNAIVSLIGAGLMYAGWISGMNWLIGLGLFIAWVPWLAHRGLSHTVWAVLLWGAIGRELEQYLQIEGIAVIAAAGYASHLLADTLTPSGVKWLYPLYHKSIKLN